MFKNSRFHVIIIIPLLLLLSCSPSHVAEKDLTPAADGKYDSVFPYRNSSKQLTEISSSIRLINSIAFYTSYVLAPDSKITSKEVSAVNLDKVTIKEVFFNRTASGTATIISEDMGTVTLLTVAHVVCFPDTILSYFINPDGSTSKFIQSISIKAKQNNYISDFPDNGEVDIIIKDTNRDIAIIGKKFPQSRTVNMPVFKYPWGNSSELEWGSFVYVFGFPMNYKMVSKGIVSNPGREKYTFLIDAVFNRGYSGGIVLAVRDGVPNFELVGLVRSVPADYELTIRPMTTEHDFDYNPMIPYKGEVFVDREQILRTGITKIIGIESVKEFILEKKDELAEKGYILKEFFAPPNQGTKLIRPHL